MAMSCRPECITPTPHQAHCATCHRTFGGVTNFDKHRRDGRCVDPATLGMTLTETGVWRYPMTEEQRERMEWAR